MNKTRVSSAMTFVASVVVGFGAAIAIASAAAVSQAAPSLRPVAQAAAVEVVRLEPVVVTVSKTYYDAVRTETELARANASTKVTRG